MKLLNQAVIIAKAGVPQVQLAPLDLPSTKREMSTLKDSISILDTFDNLFEDEIAYRFNKRS